MNAVQWDFIINRTSTLLLLASSLCAAPGTGSVKELQICDLLHRLDSFDGKRVAVRGIYRFSMEVAGLYSDGCKEPLILDGAKRAQALYLEPAGKSPELQAQLAHFNEVVDRVKKGGGRQAINVTFVGTVVTRNPKLHLLGQSEGARMFGPVGGFPAQLEVDSIGDITIEDEPREPSNMELRKLGIKTLRRGLFPCEGTGARGPYLGVT
ncbi:MAG: hypothetical protein ABSH56_01725 [Bryobacteraceae bacterium]|jgi:hypothetical protein